MTKKIDHEIKKYARQSWYSGLDNNQSDQAEVQGVVKMTEKPVNCSYVKRLL